tara:strand:- start:779 stop:1210 length:432 start_codon:yes stop_codon:yes gene_type:complete
MPKIRAAFKDVEVSAGILGSAGRHEDSRESVAQVAAYNEYGTAKIPERPAFRASFHKNRKKYLNKLIAISKKTFKTQRMKLSAFDALGKEARNDIQMSIAGGSWVANAESTQLRKGKGKQLINDPLINSGQMINSVDYKVKRK